MPSHLRMRLLQSHDNGMAHLGGAIVVGQNTHEMTGHAEATSKTNRVFLNVQMGSSNLISSISHISCHLANSPLDGATMLRHERPFQEYSLNLSFSLHHNRPKVPVDNV
jgi:hypothetical protein